MSLGIGIYAKNSQEAVDFYCRLFALELGYHVRTEDGNFFHSELMKNGKPFLAVAEADAANLPNGMSMAHDNPVELGYTAASEEEFYRIYASLKEKGKIILEVCTLPWSPLAAVVMDQYGVRWYITLPQHRPTDDECFA